MSLSPLGPNKRRRSGRKGEAATGRRWAPLWLPRRRRRPPPAAAGGERVARFRPVWCLKWRLENLLPLVGGARLSALLAILFAFSACMAALLPAHSCCNRLAAEWFAEIHYHLKCFPGAASNLHHVRPSRWARALAGRQSSARCLQVLLWAAPIVHLVASSVARQQPLLVQLPLLAALQVGVLQTWRAAMALASRGIVRKLSLTCVHLALSLSLSQFSSFVRPFTFTTQTGAHSLQLDSTKRSTFALSGCSLTAPALARPHGLRAAAVAAAAALEFKSLGARALASITHFASSFSPSCRSERKIRTETSRPAGKRRRRATGLPSRRSGSCSCGPQ